MKATYAQIKEYVLNKYGFKVSSLNIAQVKKECGIIERENFNKPSNNYKQPNCPKHKADAIKDAFEHFRMI
jgi:ribosomal protein L23